MVHLLFLPGWERRHRLGGEVFQGHREPPDSREGSGKGRGTVCFYRLSDEALFAKLLTVEAACLVGMSDLENARLKMH